MKEMTIFSRPQSTWTIVAVSERSSPDAVVKVWRALDRVVNAMPEDKVRASALHRCLEDAAAGLIALADT